MPNPDVMHDFVRSGISIDGIRQVWRNMVDRMPQPLADEARSSAADLPQVQKLPVQLRNELSDKEVVNAPGAPHAGLYWDSNKGVFVNNPTNLSPPHVDDQQVMKAAISTRPEEDIRKVLNLARAVRPDLVAQGLPMIDARDPAGAVARIAAADPNIANLVRTTLNIDIPAPYYADQSEADKWQAALNEEAPTPGQLGKDILNLPPLPQVTAGMNWLTEHLMYPLVAHPLRVLQTKVESPQAQILDQLIAAEPHSGEPSGESRVPVDLHPQRTAELKAEADQIYQYLQEQGVNYVEIEGQRVELFKSEKQAGTETYADWAKANPGANLALGVANPATWIGPGSIIKAAQFPLDVSRFLKETQAVGDLNKLARAANQEAKASEALKAAQTASDEANALGKQLDRWPYNTRMAPPKGVPAGMKEVDLATEAPVKEPTRVENLATHRANVEQFKALDQQLQEAKGLTATRDATIANTQKSYATAQVRLNALQNTARPLPEQQAIIADAQKTLEGIGKRLEEANNLPGSKPADVEKLMQAQNDLIDQMHDHVTSAPMPMHSDASAAQKELDALDTEVRRLQASRRIKGQDIDLIDEQMSKLVTARLDAQAKWFDASSPLRHMKPVYKLLSKRWVESIDHAVELDRESNLQNKLATQMISSRVESPLGRAYSAAVSNWHHLEWAQANPDSLVAAGLRLINSGKIVRQKVEEELSHLVGSKVTQVPGLEGADLKSFQEWIEHPDRIPANVGDKTLEAIVETKAFFADAAAELSNREIITEIEHDYFPHWTAAQQGFFRAAVGYKGELPITAPPLKPRVIPEAQSALTPTESIGQYVQAITRVLANRHIRAAVRDGVFEDKTPFFIPYTEVPEGGAIPLDITKGRKYVPRPTMGGHVDAELSDLLDRIQAPISKFRGGRILGKYNTLEAAQAAMKAEFTAVAAKIVKKDIYTAGEGYKKQFVVISKDMKDTADNALRDFNNWYKRNAMRIPLVHTWNQLSAGMGVGLGPLINIPVGAIISRHPEALALASREMFLQPSKTIADAIEKVIADNPHDQELAEALDAFKHKPNRILAAGDHFLWDSVVRNQQIGVWFTLRNSLIKKGFAETDAGISAGKLAEQIAGISNPKLLQGWEQWLRDHILFAYSWNKKHVTIPSEAIKWQVAKKISPELSEMQAKLVTKLARRYILRYELMSTLSLYSMQMMLQGSLPRNNDVGHENDLEFTNLYNWMYGPDGQRHYINWPLLNFHRFYTSKAQLFADDGPLGGVVGNFANIAMPVPAFLASAVPATLEGRESGSAAAGQVAQQADPFNRNFFGPLVRSAHNEATGRGSHAETALSLMGITGLHTYAGPHKKFELTPLALQQQKARDLELALHMGINPPDATPEQQQEAERRLAGESLFGTGFDLSEFATVAGGSPAGSGGPLSRLNSELADLEHRSIVEMGFKTEDELKQASRMGVKGAPISLLTPTEKAELYAAHPEIKNAFNASSDNKDLKSRRETDTRTAFFNGLGKIVSEAHTKQQALDDALASRQITSAEWRTQHKTIRDHENQQIKGLKEGVPEAIWNPDKPADNASPQDIAYTDYHKISLDDPQYQNTDFTQNIGAWQADRNSFLAQLDPQTVEYIKNKDNQNRTPTEIKYENAASKYGQFLDQHTWLNKQLSFAMGLTATERRIYMELHPEIASFISYKDAWWKVNPDVAQFYHPLDQDQWRSWSSDEQAVKLADWVIEYRIGHPEWLTAWQRSLIENPAAQQYAISGWTDQQVALYYAYLEQDQIDFHSRYRRRTGVSATSSVKHSGNLPFNQQPNIFAGSGASTANTSSIF